MADRYLGPGSDEADVAMTDLCVQHGESDQSGPPEQINTQSERTSIQRPDRGTSPPQSRSTTLATSSRSLIPRPVVIAGDSRRGSYHSGKGRSTGVLVTSPRSPPSFPQQETSFFQGARGVDISGGRFAAPGGDYIGGVTYNGGVTINNYASIERDQGERTDFEREDYREFDIDMEANMITSTGPRILSDCDIYTRHLAVKNRGFPLWIPEPNNNLCIEYRRQGISIGDVGIITQFGNFDFLFNICTPENHPINQDGVPEGFSQFPAFRTSDIQRYREFDAGAFLTSTSVDKSRYEGGHLNRSMIFESSAMEGAILTMPNGAKTLQLANEVHFEQYVAQHVESWYRYAIGIRGRKVDNGDVRLVLGRDNSETWGMATFLKASTQSDSLKLEFKPMDDSSPGRRYIWDISGTAAARTGPSREQVEELRTDERPNVENQTLFVRTINATLDGEVWSRLISKIFGKAGNLAQGQTPLRGWRASSSTNAGTAVSPAHNVSYGQVSTGHYVLHKSMIPASDSFENLVTISSNPASARIPHPSNGINTLVLQNLPESFGTVKMIITKDSDWMAVITEDDRVLPNAEDLFLRIMESHTLKIADGIVFFEPRSSLELDSVSEAEFIHEDVERGNKIGGRSAEENQLSSEIMPDEWEVLKGEDISDQLYNSFSESHNLTQNGPQGGEGRYLPKTSLHSAESEESEVDRLQRRIQELELECSRAKAALQSLKSETRSASLKSESFQESMELRTEIRKKIFCTPNRAGNALCAWHNSRRERRVYPPRNSPPGYLNCGCTYEEALFEESLSRNGVGSYLPGDSVRVDPEIRYPLLKLLQKRYGYKDGDFEYDPLSRTWGDGESPAVWEQAAQGGSKKSQYLSPDSERY